MQKELFAQLAPVVIFCKLTAQYHNQEIDTGKFMGIIQISPALPALFYVCAFCSITHAGPCGYHSQDT